MDEEGSHSDCKKLSNKRAPTNRVKKQMHGHTSSSPSMNPWTTPACTAGATATAALRMSDPNQGKNCLLCIQLIQKENEEVTSLLPSVECVGSHGEAF